MVKAKQLNLEIKMTLSESTGYYQSVKNKGLLSFISIEDAKTAFKLINKLISSKYSEEIQNLNKSGKTIVIHFLSTGQKLKQLVSDILDTLNTNGLKIQL